MLNKLKRGNKYTIVGNDGWMEFKMQVTILDFMYKQYAQYEAVPFITYKKKGGRKIQTMYLSYKYSFIEGWHNIEMNKNYKEDKYFMTCEGMKYEEIKENINNIILFSGECGKVNTNKNYESLIDHSTDLIIKYGKDSKEYKQGLKEIFTYLNYLKSIK